MSTQSTRGIPVAAHPAENAPSYAQVRDDAERASDPFTDDSTPPRHFGVTVTNLGGTQTYWFKGDPGDPLAPVVARSQTVNGHTSHYVGGGFLGGTLVTMNTTPPPTLEEAQEIATDPSAHTREGAATVRSALDRSAATRGDTDGWLWADEALSHIEHGYNVASLWQKVADNLATLTTQAPVEKA